MRKNKGVSQEELGRYLNIDRTTISRYERGIVYVHKDDVENMCKYLEIEEINNFFTPIFYVVL